MAGKLDAPISPSPDDDGWLDDELQYHQCVSPLSDRSPLQMGTKLARYFPEISSHFGLVSPGSTAGQPIQRSIDEPLLVSGRKRFYSTDTEYTADSSLCSNEIPDSASSCYSRQSSITSVSSEPSRHVYRSADAFSIISPTRAGVFDDSESVRRAPSTTLAKSPTCVLPQEKPLPREPAIQLAPLAIRNHPPLQHGINTNGIDRYKHTVSTNPANDRRRHQPTLSQAAEELENALAGITESPESDPRLSVLDAPLQISRGNMDMIPSRPPPPPPISTRMVTQASNDVPPVQQKQQKKSYKSKMSFPFSIPVFHRKIHRAHVRAQSSPDVLESPTAPSQEEPASKEIRGESREHDVPSALQRTHPRPASAGGEKKKRAKLPRLWTDTTGSIAQYKEENSDATNIDKVHDTVEEKVCVASSKNLHRSTHPGYCQIELYQSPPEMIYELDSGPASRLTPVETRNCPATMPTNTPDDAILAIFQQLCSLDDLFHLATVSKQFYRVFKANELKLIKKTVFKMSPPAWELREMSPPWDSEWQILVDPDAPVPEYTASNYLRCYAQDIYTLAQLKSLVLARCGTFIRPGTVRGLAGLDTARAAELDDAFWRIWTFCRIFGSGKNRESDITGQLDWLNGGVAAKNSQRALAVALTEPFGMNNVLFEPPAGFGQGNKGGLTKSQLYDMTEIWTCLGVLLQPIHGKCKEARETGIFEGHNVPDNNPSKEEAVLEEWTFYILSLGPSAVLNLGSICPADNGLTTFERAKSIGLTKWEQSDSGISRAAFLKEAVSKAYKPREAPRPARSPRLSQSNSQSSHSSTSHVSSSSTDSSASNFSLPSHRRRQAAYAEQLRNRNRLHRPYHNTFAEERPISNYGLIMNRLAGLPSEQPPLLPVTPTSMTPLSPPRANFAVPTSQRSTAPAAPPMPPNQTVQLIPANQTIHSTIPLYRPQVCDPVDQALGLLVGQLGFPEEDAKWALKITDTGEGINADAAVDLLLQEQQRCDGRTSVSSGRNSLVSSVMSNRESSNAGWRWA